MARAARAADHTLPDRPVPQHVEAVNTQYPASPKDAVYTAIPLRSSDPVGGVPPAEFEEACYRGVQAEEVA